MVTKGDVETRIQQFGKNQHLDLHYVTILRAPRGLFPAYP